MDPLEKLAQQTPIPLPPVPQQDPLESLAQATPPPQLYTGLAGPGHNIPRVGQPQHYGEMRAYKEQSPGAQWGSYAIPRKDKLAWLNQFKAHEGVNLDLRDPVLDALYNVGKMAERDGKVLFIESGRDGRHAPNSFHYHGEGVDINFKDKKGQYLPAGEVLDRGRHYADMAGFGSLYDEYNHGAKNGHLHLAWGNEDVGMPGVTTFRRRKPGTPEYYAPFRGDAGSDRTAARPTTPSSRHYIPTQADSIAMAYGLDHDIFSNLVQHESNFDPHAVSPAGAFGLTQLRPATAAELGARHGYSVDDIRNSPALQLKLGAEYLKQQLDAFGGDYARALAAYNAGPGTVQNFIAGKGSLPEETQNYVFGILHTGDPNIDSVSSATNAVYKGGIARKWNPEKAKDVALTQMNKIAGQHASWVSGILGGQSPQDFASNYTAGLSDPNNPGSFLYNKSPLSTDSADPKAVDYGKGAINAGLDLMQDFLHGFLHLVPKPERFKEINAETASSSSYFDKALGLVSNTGSIAGQLAMGELAAAKLFGAAYAAPGFGAGLRGLLSGTSTGGLLEGLPISEGMRSVLGLGALSYVDGLVSNMADWMHGDFAKGADILTALGKANGMGMFAASVGISIGMGALPLASGALAMGQDLAGVPGKLAADFLTKSKTGQAAFGAGFGAISGGAAATVSNLSGFSDAMFGGPISIPDSIMGGGVMGGAGTFVTGALGKYAFSKLPPEAQAKLQAYTDQSLEHFNKANEATGGMLGKHMVQAVLKHIGDKTNQQDIAATTQTSLSIKQDLERRSAKDQLMQRQVAVVGQEAQRLDQGFQHFGNEAQNIIRTVPEAGQYMNNVASLQKIQQDLATLEKTPPQNPEMMKQMLQEKATLTKQMGQIQTAQQSLLEKQPPLRRLAQIQTVLEQMGPQRDQAQQRFAKVQQEYKAYRGGADMLDSMLRRTHQELDTLLQTWDGKNAFRPLLRDKLFNPATAPEETAIPWGSRDALTGTGISKDLYSNYREALHQEVFKEITGTGNLADALAVKEAQILKSHGVKRDSGILGEGLVSASAITHDPVPVGVPNRRQQEELAHILSPAGKAIVRPSALKVHETLQQSRLQWELPAKGDNPVQHYKGSALLDTHGWGRVLDMEELTGLREPIGDGGWYREMAQGRKLPIPTVGSLQEFNDKVLPLIKIARDAGDDKLPVRFTSSDVAKKVRDSLYNQKNTRLKAIQEARETLKEQAQANAAKLKPRLTEEVPGAKRLGDQYDVSEAYNPAYIFSRIHKTENELLDVAQMNAALDSRDINKLKPLLDKHKEVLGKEVQDLALVDKLRTGQGRETLDNIPTVLSSEAQNVRMGLDVDPDVIHSQPLDDMLQLFSHPASGDFLAIDSSTGKAFAELLHSSLNSTMEGRNPTDYKGLAAMAYGNDVVHRMKAVNYMLGHVEREFRSILDNEAKSLAKGVNKDEFHRDLTDVLEDAGKYHAFLEKYSNAGKTALFYSNQVKRLAEMIKAGSPDLATYMRTQVFPAYFPRYTEHWLQRNTGTGTESTTLGSEMLREGGTLSDITKEANSWMRRIEGAGHNPETFHNLSPQERVEALFKSKLMGATADQFAQSEPKHYTKMVKEAERAASAFLFSEREVDPAIVLTRHLRSVFKAESSRRFLSRLSNMSVDISEGKTSPVMKPMLWVAEQSDTMPPKMSDRFYKKLSDIPGWQNAVQTINGKEVPSNRVYLHPDAFDYLAHTALHDSKLFGFELNSPMMKAYDRFASTVNTWSLMGSIVPFFRHTMVANMAEMMFTPLRSIGFHEAGRALITNPDREYRLAVVNALRSGVNSRSLASTTRAISDAVMEAMGPEEARRHLGVENTEVGRLLQAIDPTDPAKAKAYDQLGGLSKIAADVLGAPTSMDYIFNREVLWKNIEAGMIGGFYHRQALYNQKYSKVFEEAGLSPQARQAAIDDMAAQVTNQVMGAMPQHMVNGNLKKAFSLGVMTPSWFTGKANMILDALDGVLGLGQKVVGVQNKDVQSIGDILSKTGMVKRKYANYPPEVRQAIRTRMATTIAGGLFAGFMGTQMLNMMLHGTDTITMNNPDKWFSVLVGDRYMSGFVPGHVKDIVQGLTGMAKGEHLGIITDLIGRNMMPLPKTVFQVMTNRDDFDRQIYGVHSDAGLQGAKENFQDIAAYMAKRFINFEEGFAYKPNATITEASHELLDGPFRTGPNAMNDKEYLLQTLGLYSARDNTAMALKADNRQKLNFYNMRLLDSVRPFVQKASDESDPKKRSALLQEGWQVAIKGMEVKDQTLAKYLMDGKVRMTLDQYNALVQRTLAPAIYAAHTAGSNAAGLATQEALKEKLDAQDAAQTQNPVPLVTGGEE